MDNYFVRMISNYTQWLRPIAKVILSVLCCVHILFSTEWWCGTSN